VAGALFFGWLTDRVGRKMIFNVTLGLYVAAVLASAFAWDFLSFALFRFATGAGIGGEYAAINSAIDELIPARLRGRIDLLVNGSFWLGAVLGSGGSLLLLDEHLFPIDLGWRLGFGIGAALGGIILILRRFVPESPRWLVTHGRGEEAEQTLSTVEQQVSDTGGGPLPPPDGKTMTVHPRPSFGFGIIFRAMLGPYRSRSILALVLMVAQAFLFNSVFFTYGLVLEKFDHVAATQSGRYILPLAVSNFLGPLILGHFFDSIGRRRMIAGTFGLAGILLAATAILFGLGTLTALTQTICWIGIFFIASAAASSAYLTASEIFPLETRALAIAVFFALGTLIGGSMAPTLFGWLIGTGNPWAVSAGYAIAAVLMLIAAGTEAALGIDAEGKSLESIARPLSG
jgi:MFS family permease